MLQTMRSGRAPVTVDDPPVRVRCLPQGRQALLWGSVIAASIALFPQALVPAAMKVTGNVERLWFLALYAPGPAQWAVIAAMSLLALGLYVAAYRIYRSAQRGPAPASALNE
jgi:ABC-2 type transport system permease protein